MRVLVTGCLGFIGSHFIKYTIKNFPDVHVVGFSRDTIQKNKSRLDSVLGNLNFELIYGDLAGDISGLAEHIDVIVNFAAKTFVDHSILDPDPFIRSNITGTYRLLEQARRYKTPLFVQISTDEVYGSILEGSYREDSRLNPTNPYSATKAAADMMVISYGNTYGQKYIITRTENNYGSFQHPQKVFPVFVSKAMRGEPLPVYGDGRHRRMWLRVEDHCSAIWHLINRQASGIYHIAGEQELENIELANIILECLGLPDDRIKFIDDRNIRPGHDRRYALGCSKLRALGWEPKYNIDNGIREVVEWYKENLWWTE